MRFFDGFLQFSAVSRGRWPGCFDIIGHSHQAGETCVFFIFAAHDRSASANKSVKPGLKKEIKTSRSKWWPKTPEMQRVDSLV